MSLLALTAVITVALTATAPLNTAGWFMIDAPTLRELVAEHRLLGCPHRVGVRFLTSWSLLAFYGSEC